MEDEGDGGVPGAPQDAVHQAPLVVAVVPLGQVTGAVRPGRRRPGLSAAHTAAAPEPDGGGEINHCLLVGPGSKEQS